MQRFRSSTSGTAAIEFAIVAPIIIMLFGGVIEFGRAFLAYTGANWLASQYAIAWADCSDRPTGICGVELVTFGSSPAVTNLVPQLNASQLNLTMFQVKMNGTTPNVVYAYPTGGSMSATQIAAAQNILTNGDVGVVVTATYSHSLQFFQSLMTPFMSTTMTASFNAVQLKG